jgi:hypothetical protein
MNADKSKGKLVLVQDFVVAAEATRTQAFIGVHRRSSAVNPLLTSNGIPSAVPADA